MAGLKIPKIPIVKSWKLTPQVLILTIIGVIIILGILVFVLQKKEPSPPPGISPVSQPPQTTEEILKPGETGEILESEIEVETLGYPEFPPVIFNTSGKIVEVKEDRLIVSGSGSNFADQKPRNLIVIFHASTLTFGAARKVKYQGLEGLKHLVSGAEILIEGEENVRGKTEFIARTINVL